MAQRRWWHVPCSRRQRNQTLKDQWLAIVNPRAGGNRNRSRLAHIRDGLGRIAVKTVLTNHSGHATELAGCAQDYVGLVAVGGDGTLFEILKGFDRVKQRIALIPAGRGNSLGRHLGLLHRQTPLDVIHRGDVRRIDLLEVEIKTADGLESNHFSASTVAVGYPVAVAMRARDVAWMGRMSYATAAAVIQPLHFRAIVEYEGALPHELYLSGFIANNTRYLANFLAFHKGNCHDGLFDVMQMDAGIVKQTMHNLSALSRTRFYEPYAPMQAGSVKLRLETPQNLMIDGEIFPEVVSFDIRVLPSALACNGPRTQ